MADSIEQVAPAWAVFAPVVLAAFALVGASLNGALIAQANGRPFASGLSAPIDEIVRLMRQRRRTTVSADSLLWRIAGTGLLLVALLMIIPIPIGGWTLADLSIGVVWFNAMDGLVWGVIWLAGWGANSAYSLIGGYRFIAQALSYELPVMFALIAPAVAARSLRMGDVVAAQQDLWFVVWMPVAFLVFCASVVAFSSWGPFGSAAGRDIAGGVFAELSGVDRLIVRAGRYAVLAAGAAFAVAVFLGGGAGPLFPDWVWTLVKTVVLLSLFIIARHRLPAIRPERFAEVAWIIVIPLILLQVLVVAIVMVNR
ncbi:MAG: complex I subunit 1 family protein [Actinomycetota bacterium]